MSHAVQPPREWVVTYDRGRGFLWHDCGKRTLIVDGAGGLRKSHVCGPEDSPWDSATRRNIGSEQ